MRAGVLRWLPALLLMASAAGGLRAGTVRLAFVTDAEGTVVELRGLEAERLAELERGPPSGADWSRLLAVYTEEAILTAGTLPPLLGSYSVVGSAVRFTPRFALAPGVTYVAVFRDPQQTGMELRESFSPARPDLAPSTIVAAIYPSVAVVPENLLRLYLQFSAPMSQGRAREHIQLLDQDGVRVEGPFVAPERELWSPDGTRLTLFFDPGRIKRSVGPNLEVGPPLLAGRRYRLVVDRQFADARGVPLARGHSKEFEVAEPDREQPLIRDWVLEPPTSSSDAVVLKFPEPLDRGLLAGLLEVLDADGELPAGTSTVDAGESRWSFRPEKGWSDEVYRIRVDTLLEDLAGNSLRRAFEVATDISIAGGDGPPFVDLPFAIP